MKKIISGISALVIMAAMAVPFSAFAEDVTTINPKGGTPFSVDPKPGTANSTVQFEVNPAYTVTIPATVTLEGEYGSTYTGSGKISTDKVFLNEGKKIVVSLTSASKFNMKTSTTAEYNLPYTAEGAFGKLTDKENGGKVAEFETSTTAKTVDISFTTDETPKYAGSYTDPVVFTIEIDDIETVTPSPEPNGE